MSPPFHCRTFSITQISQRETASLKQEKDRLEAERTQWLEAVRREAEADAPAGAKDKKKKEKKEKKEKH